MSKIEDFESYTFFPGQHWGHTWERQHELITRFAKNTKKRIDVCQPLGLLNHNFLSINFFYHVIHYLKKSKDVKGKNNPIESNMHFLKRWYLPWHNTFIGKINYLFLKRFFFKKDQNFFWSTYMNHTVYEFFKRSSFKVYDLAERRTQNPYLSESIKALEVKAVKEADVVFVDNHATLNDYKKLNKNIFYIPQGVNTSSFYKKEDNRKYIGYIGNLHFAIDYLFLEQLVKINTNETFLFVGEVLEKKAETILSLPNVIHIPKVPKKKLNDYLAQMKIGLIPYLINDVTIGVYPTKLFEYLAAGVPVVSTNLPEVMQYENTSYLKIVSQPCTLNYSFDMCGCEEIVDMNTWDIRWDNYLNCINQCLK